MKSLAVNWKTTLFGIIALVPSILNAFGVHLSPEINSLIIGIAGGGVGFMAKDKNVSGGSVAATPEAKQRIEGK